MTDQPQLKLPKLSGGDSYRFHTMLKPSGAQCNTPMNPRYLEDLTLGERETLPGSHALGEADIIAFAREWDPQPFHIDPDYALTVPQGGLTAASGHLYAIASKLLFGLSPPIAGIASLRHELEIPNAAQPGDTLTLSVTPVELQPSKSKPDRGLLTLDGELQTQTGKVVLKFRSLMLIYRRPPGRPAEDALQRGSA